MKEYRDEMCQKAFERGKIEGISKCIKVIEDNIPTVAKVNVMCHGGLCCKFCQTDYNQLIRNMEKLK